MSHDLNGAIRRMRAVIQVLDEDLAAADRTLGAPLPRAELSPVDWEQADAARGLVEASLAATERAAASAALRAEDWGEKAAIAVRRGDFLPARQALEEATAAEAEAAALTLECSELHVFLTEWAVRVTRAH